MHSGITKNRSLKVIKPQKTLYFDPISVDFLLCLFRRGSGEHRVSKAIKNSF